MSQPKRDSKSESSLKKATSRFLRKIRRSSTSQSNDVKKNKKPKNKIKLITTKKHPSTKPQITDKRRGTFSSTDIILDSMHIDDIYIVILIYWYYIFVHKIQIIMHDL